MRQHLWPGGPSVANNLFDALRRGGWHAPVVTIDGKLFSQGVVPDPTRFRVALESRWRDASP